MLLVFSDLRSPVEHQISMYSSIISLISCTPDWPYDTVCIVIELRSLSAPLSLLPLLDQAPDQQMHRHCTSSIADVDGVRFRQCLRAAALRVTDRNGLPAVAMRTPWAIFLCQTCFARQVPIGLPLLQEWVV